ncbi:MAG TPA: hypothetical protein VNH43_03745, partial [Vicinamibacteria bacterium]|nr:hypothetical protein [Vicinamibacteria bacterium]
MEWTALAVQARLDGDGRLHVRERQTILFDGDWNGGERTFRLRPTQTIELHELRRIDHGAVSIVTKGSLDFVDNYDWVRPGVLRWRVRSPAEPPFRNTEITYLLDYTLSNVLRSGPRGYLLDHDFAFPDRPGPIRRFSLDLEVDPAWVPGAPVPKGIDVGPLAAGQKYVVSLPLAYVGPGVPAAVDRRGPRLRRLAVSALFLLSPLLAAAVLLRERRVGRLGPLASVDRPWLDQNLFTHPPELIGAAWDEAVGPAEVAAVIARMVGEGKVRSTVDEGRHPDLRLELLVDRQALEGYERKLVDGLFFDGNATSTSAIKAHYHDKGFSPAAILRPWLQPEAERLVGEGRVA